MEHNNAELDFNKKNRPTGRDNHVGLYSLWIVMYERNREYLCIKQYVRLYDYIEK